MQFVNYSKFEAPNTGKVSRAQLVKALLEHETKNRAKVEKLVEGLGNEIEFSKAVSLFTDKLKAATVLSIHEAYEVIFSDGVSQMRKFKSEQQALDFMKSEIASNKKLRDIAVYKPGMHSTTQTELVVKFWGDGSYLDNVSKKDPKLAAKKLEESVKIVKEDWGGSDQAAMNKSIHRDAGSPKTMPSPFDPKLRSAAESAVDFYWDEWPEYAEDRDGLIDNAIRSYLRSYFKEQFALLVKMFESYDGNMSDFKYEFPMKFEEETGISPNAIKKISKKGKGFEVRTSSYMGKESMEKVGAAMGLELKSYEKSNIVVAVYEAVEESLTMDDVLQRVNENNFNDPVLIAFRAAKMKREQELAKPKRKPLYGKEREKAEDQLWQISQDLKDLYADRGQMLIDMEQEAEVEGGPIADKYGADLDKIESEIQKLIAKRSQLEMRLAESFVTSTSESEVVLDGGWVDTKELSNVDHTRLIKWISKELDNTAKVTRSGRGYSIDTSDLDKEDTQYLIDYLKSQGYLQESVEINEDWGTFDTPEGKMVAKELDKAWNTFAKTVDAAHKEWLKAVQKYRGEAGKGSGFSDSEGRDAVISSMEWFLEKVFMVDNRFGGIDYRKYRSLMGESVEVSEASIPKIQKEWAKVTADMKTTVDAWKGAEGKEKESLLAKLKDLTAQKKKLEADLDKAVGLQDADAELVGEAEDYSDQMSYGQLERCIDYSTMIRERIQTGTSLDPWMHSQIAVAKNELNSIWDAIDGADGEVEGQEETVESVVTEGKKGEVVQDAGVWKVKTTKEDYKRTGRMFWQTMNNRNEYIDKTFKSKEEAEQWLSEESTVTEGVQYSTMNLDKGVKGRYRLQSDEVDVIKALNLSGFKYGRAFVDEVGFETASDRNQFIKILDKMYKDGKLTESTLNEATVERTEMMAWIEKTFDRVRTTEEFDGSPGGIWISGENGETLKNKRIYHYYANAKSYTFGVLNDWEKQLNKRGWYSEWYDAGTVMIWPL